MNSNKEIGIVQQTPRNAKERRLLEEREKEMASIREREHREAVGFVFTRISAVAGSLKAAIGEFSQAVNFQMNRQGFWSSSNTAEKIALMHSELSEALEADRKDLDSAHLPGFSGLEEEMADTVIRILDFCQQHELRLVDAMVAKMDYNLSRPPMHGKKY